MKNWKQMIIIALFVVPSFVALTWLSTEIYIAALNISSYGAMIIHVLTIVFWIVFIFSFFSGEMVSASHIRIIYRTCNIIFGFMFYFFLGSVLLSILLLILPTVSSAVAEFILFGSLVLSIIGLLQAKKITTTSYEVKLDNAPDSWNGKKAVFLSDTHFGLMNHKNFSDKIIDTILKINPDLVLHGGDFYDGPKINTAPITESWKRLTANIAVFYTSGNHEAFGPYELFMNSIREAGVTVLLNEKTIHDGVQIAGITYLRKDQDAEAQKVLEILEADKSLPLILINHPPTFHKDANKIGTNLMLSGHTHRGQFSPIGLITRLIYKKYNFGFHKFQNMTAITSRGVGTAGPPMRLFTPPELVIIKFKTKD